MVEWKKLSGSINYYIRNVWKEELLRSNEDLLEDYLKDMEGEEVGEYEYLDKQSYEWVKLTDEEINKIKSAFLERIEKKKVKYADEIEEIRIKKEQDDKELEERRKNFKVINLDEWNNGIKNKFPEH